MKQDYFIQYKSLVKAFLTDYFFGDKSSAFSFKNRHKSDNRSGGKKAVGIILIAISALFLLAYFVSIISELTILSVENGFYIDLPYFIVGIGQLLIMFLGTIALYNIMYFSKDNALLQTFPVKHSTIFAAKFTVVYLLQLFISVIFYIPALISYGIVLSINGIKIGAQFYVISVFTPLVAPLIPLLLIAFLSIPTIYALSLIKNRDIAKTVLSFIMALGFLAVYFAGIFTFSNMDISGNSDFVNSSSFKMIGFFRNIAIVDYNLIQAMLGIKIALNLFIYFAIILGAIFLILLLSSFTFKKAMAFSIEEGSGRSSGKKEKNENYSPRSIFVNLLIKDLKTVIKEPTLLMSSLIGLIIVPIMVVFMNFDISGFGAVNQSVMILGIINYAIIVMMSGTNYLSLVGFSIEGKNFALLKSLPIRAKDIIGSKILSANVFNIIFSLEVAVVFSVTGVIKGDYYSPLVAFINAILLAVIGAGSVMLNLYTDLKNPQFNFSNLQNLTKNNKKVLKPMLISLFIGMLSMASGITFSTIFANEKFYCYLCYFIALAIICGVYFTINYFRFRRDAEELFERTEC